MLFLLKKTAGKYIFKQINQLQIHYSSKGTITEITQNVLCSVY